MFFLDLTMILRKPFWRYKELPYVFDLSRMTSRELEKIMSLHQPPPTTTRRGNISRRWPCKRHLCWLAYAWDRHGGINFVNDESGGNVGIEVWYRRRLRLHPCCYHNTNNNTVLIDRSGRLRRQTIRGPFPTPLQHRPFHRAAP